MSLSTLFEPKRVIVTGLDERPPVSGRELATHLAAAGFRGELSCVDFRGGTIGERSILAPSEVAPGPVDLVILCGDPRDALATAETWLSRGVGALLMTADPRSDLDTDEPEETLLTRCHEAGARLVGPRSRGVVVPAIGLVAVDAPVAVAPGPLALVSNGGGQRFVAALEAVHATGLGVHEAIDLGAGLDVTLPELLLRWKDDARVGVIAIDGVANGGAAALVSALRATVRVKPVLVQGPDAALLAECGAIPVADHRALAALAAYLGAPERPRLTGPRIAVVSNDGAQGALAVAELTARGLTPAEMGEPTLRAVLSEVHANTVMSPSCVDLLAGATPRHLTVAARTAADDPGVDGVLVAASPAPALELSGAAAPIIVAEASLGASTLAGLLRLTGAEAGPLEPPATLPNGAHPQLAQAVMVAAHLTHRTDLTPDEARRVLAAYGVPSLPAMAVAAPHAARRAAAGFGYPVTVTLLADGEQRQVDGLADGDALEAAVVRLFDEAGSADPRLAFEVRPSVTPSGFALEAQAHPRLGHRVTVGYHGRTAGALLPLGPQRAQRLVEDAAPELAPTDHAALADLAARVARLCTDLPELGRVQLGALAHHGGRWVAVEARVTLDPEALAFG